MKKLIYLMILVGVLISKNSFAQIPTVVYDATNSVTLTEQLTEASKQTVEMKKQLDFLKKSYDNIKKARETLEKVNAKLKKIQEVSRVINLSQNCVDRVKKIKNTIANMTDLPPKYISTSLRTCTRCLTGIISNVSTIQKILMDNNIVASDSERIQMIHKNTVEMERLTFKVCEIQYRCEDLRQKQELFRRF